MTLPQNTRITLSQMHPLTAGVDHTTAATAICQHPHPKAAAQWKTLQMKGTADLAAASTAAAATVPRT
jgi:hypothetical protein